MTADPSKSVPPDCRFASEPAVKFSAIAFTIIFVLCLAVNWPGRLNEDSVEQFIGFYNPAQLGDLHSPLSTYLWSIPAFAVKQPAGALIVQSALLAFFAATVSRHFSLRRAVLFHALIEAAVKLSLVVLAGFVIKDVLLVGLLLAGLACLQGAGGSSRPKPWLAGAVCLFALTLVVRPTNFFMFAVVAVIVVPLAVRKWRSRAVVLGVILAGLVMTVPLLGVFNTYAVNARQDHAEIQLMLFDLSGISAQTGQDFVRELPEWPAGLPDSRACYTPSEAAIIATWNPCRGYAAAGRAAYATGRKRVILFWLRSVAQNPHAYVAHRLDYVRNLLDPIGAGRDHPIYSAAASDLPGRYLYALNHPDALPRLQTVTEGRAAPDQFLIWHDNVFAGSFAVLTNAVAGFRGAQITALVISLFLLGWTWVLHWRGATLPPFSVVAAAALALGNFLMHALAGVASQERYLYPTVFCALFALLVAARHALREPDEIY